MYVVLQPVTAGLCKHVSDYPGFNCFKYLLSGKPLTVGFVRGSDFSKARHNKQDADIRKFTDKHKIHFKRIPGYEHMSDAEYREFLMAEYERRRRKIVEEFEKKGHRWPIPEALRRTKSTDRAKNPKKAKPDGFYPLVICKCKDLRDAFLDWYFTNLILYKKASRRYLDGDTMAAFPSGCNKPPGPFVT